MSAAQGRPEPDPVRQLETIREETRFELQLLHERVNALLAAEAFLTIAYTATMGSSGPWTVVVAPLLSVLGLLLAALAWPGVSATSRLVVAWTSRRGDLLQEHPQAAPSWPGDDDRRRREADQHRSLLFFRAAPVVLVVVWVVLLLCSLLLRG